MTAEMAIEAAIEVKKGCVEREWRESGERAWRAEERERRERERESREIGREREREKLSP